MIKTLTIKGQYAKIEKNLFQFFCENNMCVQYQIFEFNASGGSLYTYFFKFLHWNSLLIEECERKDNGLCQQTCRIPPLTKDYYNQGEGNFALHFKVYTLNPRYMNT